MSESDFSSSLKLGYYCSSRSLGLIIGGFVGFGTNSFFRKWSCPLAQYTILQIVCVNEPYWQYARSCG